MIIKRFNKINGFYPEPISGQIRFAFSKNNFEDFYDIKEYLNYKDYRGQKLYFYDYDTANVYSPFEKTINIVYGAPIYFEGFFYFLRDFWGRFISEEIGNLNKAEGGNWWIS